MTRQSVTLGGRLSQIALAALATFAIGSHSAFAKPPGSSAPGRAAPGSLGPGSSAPGSNAPGSQVPTVPATAKGSLDKELIRGTIRQHIAEVKHCYEMALLKNALLEGRVMVEFTIGLEGKVTAAAVSASTLNHPGPEICIRDAVASWTFPKPQGGVVVVNYPFVFKPEDAKQKS